jgi:hypothetical protein
MTLSANCLWHNGTTCAVDHGLVVDAMLEAPGETTARSPHDRVRVAGSYLHWFPYDGVRVVNADP